MPVNKKDNKKNAPAELRHSAIVPKKDQAGKGLKAQPVKAKFPNKQATALSTAGKKKKPK